MSALSWHNYKKMQRKIYKIDAENKSAGRLASEIAGILRGKNETAYLPHLDMGGIAHVINADKIKFTGKKTCQKKYYRYSGHPGGLKTKKISELKPAEILKKAVKNMLPPTKHRINMLKRLIIK